MIAISAPLSLRSCARLLSTVVQRSRQSTLHQFTSYPQGQLRGVSHSHRIPASWPKRTIPSQSILGLSHRYYADMHDTTTSTAPASDQHDQGSLVEPAFSHRPGAVAAPVSTATMLQPDAVVLNIAAKGAYLGRLSVSQLLVGGWLAGVFLSFGCSLMVQVAGIPFTVAGLHLFLGALVFPVGLTLITWHGADLLTGCFMYQFMPFLTGNISPQETLRSLIKVWLVVGVANLAGCLMLAGIGGALTSPAAASFAATLAVKKTSLSFGACFVKAVGANFLVCTAMAGAMATQTPGGKLLCIWLPIATFVAMGLEHSIANMFLIPLGMHFSDVTVYDFIVGNLIPATLGNIVGAWSFAAAMWFRHRRH